MASVAVNAAGAVVHVTALIAITLAASAAVRAHGIHREKNGERQRAQISSQLHWSLPRPKVAKAKHARFSCAKGCGHFAFEDFLAGLALGFF